MVVRIKIHLVSYFGNTTSSIFISKHLWVTFLAETSKDLEIILITTVLSFTNSLSRTSLYFSLKTSFVYSNLFSLAKTVHMVVHIFSGFALFTELMWVYCGVESLCKLLTANKMLFDLPTNECKSKYCLFCQSYRWFYLKV